jgi:hypothetical protein
MRHSEILLTLLSKIRNDAYALGKKKRYHAGYCADGKFAVGKDEIRLV